MERLSRGAELLRASPRGRGPFAVRREVLILSEDEEMARWPTRESRNPKPSELRFCALLTEGGSDGIKLARA
jgi:hypothetical protein